MFVYILIWFLVDAVDYIEETSQNKLSDLDELATNLDFPEVVDLDSAKRCSTSATSASKKRKVIGNAVSSEGASNPTGTQDIVDELDSYSSEESSESDSEYDY